MFISALIDLQWERCRRLGLSLGLGLALTLAAVAPAIAKAENSPLAQHTTAICSSSGQNGGFDGTGAAAGFAMLNASDQAVVGQVAVKGGEPNTTYTAALCQHSAIVISGLVPVAKLTTNGQGNGNAYFQVPRLAGAQGGFVALAGGPDLLVSSDVPLHEH
jgi:hypothetical protein